MLMFSQFNKGKKSEEYGRELAQEGEVQGASVRTSSRNQSYICCGYYI